MRVCSRPTGFRHTPSAALRIAKLPKTGIRVPTLHGAPPVAPGLLPYHALSTPANAAPARPLPPCASASPTSTTTTTSEPPSLPTPTTSIITPPQIQSEIQTQPQSHANRPPFYSAVAHPGYMLLGLALYSAVAIDVFDPNSAHLLQPLDTAVHQAALSIDPVLRKQVFGGVVSNGFIMAAAVGWIFTTATAMSRYNPLGWAACGLGWALWLFGGGPIQHDPLLMELTKAAFGRERPSPIHRTASFPSGHTTAVVLLVGALLFVLLPAVYGNAKRREAGQEWQGGAEVGGEGGADAQPGGFFGALYGAQNSWALWGLTTATTITGRVLVDAHWLSDTLGGAGLGLAMVSGLAMATDRIAKGSSGAGGGRDGSSSA